MLPGEFVTTERPVGFATEAGFDKEILCAISIDPMRSFEADPSYGFFVLAEIASRALSPAVNDHGTAIKIITSITRLLLLWHSTKHVNKTYSQNIIESLHLNYQLVTFLMTHLRIFQETVITILKWQYEFKSL